MVSLEKTGRESHQSIQISQYVQEESARLFPVVLSNRTRSSGHKQTQVPPQHEEKLLPMQGG